MSSSGRMQTSTPIHDSPPRLREQVQELQRNIERLAFENETLKYELAQAAQFKMQARKEIEALSLDNERLCQALQEKDIIQTKMGRQLNLVTETAYALYEKFTAFKRRYYEEQNAWCAEK